ncbi:hypothetical protein M0R72_18090 [Candidatus Pacearchaeota archaeon]|jgi:hypothetical protein|nr:hypothetical protein [Candidatus Pacearchaeota archaeon]
MKFLLDVSPKKLKVAMLLYPELVLGQFCTPLTANLLHESAWFAIDNGAYSRFNSSAFISRLQRHGGAFSRCLFVACPDVVGNARRTLEAFGYWQDIIKSYWPLALVAQDGLENLDIPWSSIKAIFIGGTTEWKDSQAAYDIVRTAKIIGKHVHVGRVNDRKRFNTYSRLDADTCDGTGVSIFTNKKLRLIEEKNKTPLLKDE